MTDEPSGGLWLSISALAAAKNISQQAVSRRVARLKAQGLLSPRPGPRGTIEICVAEFDRVTGQSTDLARATTHLSPPDGDTPNDGVVPAHVYTAEQARRTAYQADLAKLDLDERLGKLLPVDAVEAAMARCAAAMVRQIDQLPSRADDIATAVGVEGTLGARQALKAAARELRETIAREMRILLAQDDEEDE